MKILSIAQANVAPHQGLEGSGQESRLFESWCPFVLKNCVLNQTALKFLGIDCVVLISLYS